MTQTGSPGRPPFARRLWRTWWQMTRWMIGLFVVVALGMMVFMGDWRHHALGLTDRREVTVTHVTANTDRCAKNDVGDRVDVRWTDDDGRTRTGWWVACRGDGRVETGDRRELWVAPGRRGYDYSTWSLWTQLPKAALLASSILTAVVMWNERRRRR